MSTTVPGPHKANNESPCIVWVDWTNDKNTDFSAFSQTRDPGTDRMTDGHALLYRDARMNQRGEKKEGIDSLNGLCWNFMSNQTRFHAYGLAYILYSREIHIFALIRTRGTPHEIRTDVRKDIFSMSSVFTFSSSSSSSSSSTSSSSFSFSFSSTERFMVFEPINTRKADIRHFAVYSPLFLFLLLCFLRAS